MSESRNLRWDMAAIGMATFAVFVSLSLWTHDPADPIGPLVLPFSLLYQPVPVAFPEHVHTQNWCGYWGSLASHLLLQSVGIGAYLANALLYVSCIAMLRQQPFASPLGRSVGWSLVLLSCVTLPPLLHWHLSVPVPIGCGGYLGAFTSTWISQHFALPGGIILCLSALIAGLLLSTEYAILHVLSLCSVGGFRFVSKWKPMAKRVTQQSLQGNGGVAALVGGEGEGDLRGEGAGRLRMTSDCDNLIPTAPSLKVRGKEVPMEPLPTVVPTASVKPGLLASELAALNSAAQTVSTAAAVMTTEEEVVVEEEVEEEEEVRHVEVEGEEVAARGDGKHGLGGPRVRNKNDRKSSRDSLDHLDDTKLPEGSEEYVLPGIDLLTEADDVSYDEQAIEVRRKAVILEQTFKDFGFNVKVVEIETGPVIAQYEIELEAGLRLAKITNLADDLAIALRVPSVRIVAPIPGKNTVGIEVPNETRQVVRMREVIEEGAGSIKKMKIPLFLGKDVSGNPLTVDLASLPHLLIAGRTGTGKSVCLNSIISSILMTRRPDEVRMLMIDPKMVELSGYGRLPHLMHPVVTDMKKAEAILAWAVDKMEERYALLARAGVRHLVNYNQLGREELLERMNLESPDEAELIPDHLPFIVIVADEMADLMMTAGKEVEAHIIRLAQKSRAVGIHLILATQKPTVDVITGLIKSNLPARISFQVASRTDSRVVLDEMGADKLLGNGDMLFLWPGTSTLLRGQGTYLSDDEINRVVDHCSTGEQNFVHELVNLKIQREGEEEGVLKPGALKKRDELYEAAIDVVVREGRGSCSLLQRAMGIGYGRAARLIDYMAEDGIVGQYNGSQAREVVISLADWEVMRAGEASVAAPAASAPKKNRIRMTDDEKVTKPKAAVRKPVVEVEEEESWEEEEEESEVEEYSEFEAEGEEEIEGEESESSWDEE